MLLSVQAHQSRETSSVHPSVETGWLQWSYNQNIQNNTLDVKKKKNKKTRMRYVAREECF